jgi:hypothetical protein
MGIFAMICRCFADSGAEREDFVQKLSGVVRVQAPTQNWAKLGSAAKDLTSEALQVAFMRDWQQYVSMYPRLFLETYVCQNIDSLSALLVDLLSYVQMRLIVH